MSKPDSKKSRAELIAERDKWRRLDSEAGTHVESVICMRTHFTGYKPYIGWRGLGLALTEVFDERDELRGQVMGLRYTLRCMQKHGQTE